MSAAVIVYPLISARFFLLLSNEAGVPELIAHTWLESTP